MHDVRLLSVKHFTFRLLYIKHVVGVCQWCADLQIPSPTYSASVGSVEKWVRANDMYCTCARRTGLQLYGLFLDGTHSARASQVYYEALMRGPFASIDKTADPSPRSIATQSARHCPELTGVWLAVCLVSSDGPYTGIFDLKYRYHRYFKSKIPVYGPSLLR